MSSVLFDQNPYGRPQQQQQQQQAYYPAAAGGGAPLQFYSADQFGGFGGGMEVPAGSMSGGVGSTGSGNGYGGNIASATGWLSAFGTGGFDGEPPLLEELGINFSHIRAKSMTVLNPLRGVDERIMDDADLAGPLLFVLLFGVSLLLSGKVQFGYIYGVALLGSASIYMLLNLMSESGIDAYRVASVLGYCLLPMVGVGIMSVVFVLDGALGLISSALSVLWCTYAASGIFTTILRMSDQRLLVAYPVGLLYGCFALLSVFNASSGKEILGRL